MGHVCLSLLSNRHVNKLANWQMDGRKRLPLFCGGCQIGLYLSAYFCNISSYEKIFLSAGYGRLGMYARSCGAR